MQCQDSRSKETITIVEDQDMLQLIVETHAKHNSIDLLIEIDQEIEVSLKTLENAQVQMIATETETEITIATVTAIKIDKKITIKIKTKIVIKIKTATEIGQGAATELSHCVVKFVGLCSTFLH